MTATGSVAQSMTGDADIDGLFSGVKWNSKSIDFNFPASAHYYSPSYGGSQPTGFVAVSESFKSMVRNALDQFAQVANIQFNEVDPAAPSNISVARTSELTGGAVSGQAFYPGSSQAAGDIWFNSSTSALGDTEVHGRNTWRIVMHEIGHAMGLKHSHDALPGNATLMPVEHDFNDYTIMSYRRWEGGPAVAGASSQETYGSPQTLMMYDILALQTMYGANYGTHSGNNTYTWNPNTGEMSIDGVGQGAPGANRIYMTLWDGGGTDTYDLSSYTTDLSIDLNPGGRSTFSQAQLAIVDETPADPVDWKHATGNVFNALLYRDNPKSLIENAIGGSGNDTLVGNAASNLLFGGTGSDVLNGGAGKDSLTGGKGADRFDYDEITKDVDRITDFAVGEDQLDIRDVLVGYVPGVSNIKRFVGLSGASDTTVWVNADGVGIDYVPLANLLGVQMTGDLLYDMVTQGSLVLS